MDIVLPGNTSVERLIHKRYKCIPEELVKHIVESGSKTWMEKDTESIVHVKQESGVPGTSEQVIVTAILPSDRSRCD